MSPLGDGDLDARTLEQDVIDEALSSHPHPLLFVTMSGAHLYGFASRDSDYDLRGCHVAPLDKLVSMRPPRETIDVLDRDARIETDVVTHDIGKFLAMLLGRNGYVLEQVCSPLVIRGGPAFDELRSLVPGCLTRHHRHHFRGFAKSQWGAISGSSTGTVKGLLYAYRPLLAGIHLMRTREVESNLRTLNGSFKLSFIDDLIAAKVEGDEKASVGALDLEFHHAEFDRLNAELEEAADRSGLPDSPPGFDAVDDFLVRVRLGRTALTQSDGSA